MITNGSPKHSIHGSLSTQKRLLTTSPRATGRAASIRTRMSVDPDVLLRFPSRLAVTAWDAGCQDPATLSKQGLAHRKLHPFWHRLGQLISPIQRSPQSRLGIFVCRATPATGRSALQPRVPRSYQLVMNRSTCRSLGRGRDRRQRQPSDGSCVSLFPRAVLRPKQGWVFRSVRVRRSRPVMHRVRRRS